MKHAPFPLLVFVVIASTFGKEPAPTVTFVSPCECIAFHGVNRWVAKTDLTPVPPDKSAIQAITPSQIYAWEGLAPDVDMTDYTEARLAAEQKWYALMGRVVDAKVEADGDIRPANYTTDVLVGEFMPITRSRSMPVFQSTRRKSPHRDAPSGRISVFETAG
jgi:hypothetical protein